MKGLIRNVLLAALAQTLGRDLKSAQMLGAAGERQRCFSAVS